MKLEIERDRLTHEFDKVREHGARTLSQINLPYRSSKLSETKSPTGQLRAGDRVPDITVACDGAASAGVPIYSILDPSCLTLLSTENTTVKMPVAGLPSFVKILHVHAAGDTESKQAFVESFGEEGGLFAVRPDAYLGFAGQTKDRAEFLRWFNDHFSTSSDSQARVKAT